MNLLKGLSVGLLALTLVTANGQPLDEVAKLTASDRNFDDQFGTDVAIGGDWAVIGADDQDRDVANQNVLNQAGAIYFFKQSTTGAWAETQKAVASDRETNAYFGNKVDIENGRAIIGSFGKDVTGFADAGAAYIYELQPDDSWLEVAALANPAPEAGERFGSEVSIYGDYAFVTALYDGQDEAEGNFLNQAGAVYVYHRDGTGVWSLSQKLVAPNRAAADFFGSSIAQGDGYVVIGAQGQEAANQTGGSIDASGLAYAFDLNAGTWQFTQYVTHANRAAQDKFGFAAAVSGNKLIISAQNKRYVDPAGGFVSGAGALFYFERNGAGQWVEQQEFYAGVPTGYETFGWKLDMDQNNLIATTFQDSYDENEANVLSLAGAAEVYAFNAATNQWDHRQKLVASDRAKRDNFGFSVAVSGNRVLVGAYEEEHTDFGASGWKEDAGSVYYFTACSPIFGTHDFTACDSYTVPSGDETYTVSGVYNDTIPSAGGCDSILTLNLTINSSSSSAIIATACDGYTAPSGAVFTTTGQFIDVIPNAAGCDSTINIDLTVLPSSNSIEVITACEAFTSNAGNTYTATGVYEEVLVSANGCDSIHTIDLTIINSSSATTTLTVCDGYTAPSGAVYTMSGTYQDVITNTAGCDSVITIDLTVNNSATTEITTSACDSYVSGSGAKYEVSGVYTEHLSTTDGCDSVVTLDLTINHATGSTEGYGFVSKITPSDRSEFDGFGSMVATEGDWLFVGAFEEDLDENGQNFKYDAGAVYVYQKDGNGNWLPTQKLVASNRTDTAYFGARIATDMANGRIAVSAYLHNVVVAGDTTHHAGAVYIFELQAGNWVEVVEIRNMDSQDKHQFGSAIALNGNTLIATTPNNHTDASGANPIYQAGAAYEFTRDGSGNWLQTQKIVHNDRVYQDLFASSVGLTDDYLLLGARNQEGPDLNGGYIWNAGAVYAFEKDASGDWVQVQKFAPANRYNGMSFSMTIDVDGNRAAIADWGASTISPIDGSYVSRSGSVFIFERDPATGVWTEGQELYNSYPTASELFGFRPDLQGDKLVTAAIYDSENEHQIDTVVQAGSAFIFERNPATNVWSQTQKFTAPDRSYNALFGYATAFNGDEVIVSALKESYGDLNGGNYAEEAGAVYQFDLNAEPQDLHLVSSCEFYLLASGDTVWSTGLYSDTLSTLAGCDSIVHYDVTILESTTASIVVDQCGEYTAPSGAVYATSGTYVDIIPNLAGCDSLITITLNADQPSYASIAAEACDSYTSPSGLIWTESGLYSDLITNAAGCDSIIDIDLTIHQTFGATTVTNCGEYTVPSGDETYSESGTYYDTLSNAIGCDSVVEINLIIVDEIMGPEIVCKRERYTFALSCPPAGATYFKWKVRGRGHIVGKRRGADKTAVTAAFKGRRRGPQTATIICKAFFDEEPFVKIYEKEVEIIKCVGNNWVEYEELQIVANDSTVCSGDSLFFGLNQPIPEDAEYEWSVAGAPSGIFEPYSSSTGMVFYTWDEQTIPTTVYFVVEVNDRNHYIQREIEIDVESCPTKSGLAIDGFIENHNGLQEVLIKTENPVGDDHVWAICNKPVDKVEVYTYDGRLILADQQLQQDQFGQFQVVMPGIQTGVYIMNFYSNDGLLGTRRVVVSK